jgi:hypothetical protein
VLLCRTKEIIQMLDMWEEPIHFQIHHECCKFIYMQKGQWVKVTYPACCFNKSNKWTNQRRFYCVAWRLLSASLRSYLKGDFV